jgi:hypothetical protein
MKKPDVIPDFGTLPGGSDGIRYVGVKIRIRIEKLIKRIKRLFS